MTDEEKLTQSEAEQDSQRLNEEWYDQNVAPVLAELATKCSERGMSFLATVGNQGDSYQTRQFVDSHDPAIRLILFASKARGNIDSLLMAVIKDAEERGGVDFSVYLTNLKNYSEAIKRGSLWSHDIKPLRKK